MKKDRLSAAVVGLTDLVNTLRGPGGCPWDARQTFESIKMYLLEEAYEVLDAVDGGDREDICGELGDLLFQIVFLARLAEEEGAFDLVDVLERITAKMIHRHPHVFGAARLESAEEVVVKWAEIKRRERGRDGSLASELGSVPKNLPALLRAHRLLQRTAGSGKSPSNGGQASWDDAENLLKKVRDTLRKDDEGAAKALYAKLLFDLAGLAGRRGWNAEDLLQKENRRFIEHMDDS